MDLHGRGYGSPLYMAPEVISGRSTGMASDPWSACVILYRLLSGRMPFPAETFPELLSKVLSDDPAPIGTGVLEEVLRRGLEKDAADRPASADAVLGELDHLAAVDVRFGPDAADRRRPTNYVPPPTSFVGREEEVAELAALLTEEEGSLVTVTGPGGMGETRLGLKMCEHLLDSFEGGTWFVDLSEVFDLDGVCHAVAEVLGVPHADAPDPAALVAGVLRYRKPLLLVLDNFEQVVQHAAATVRVWRRAARG